MGIFSYFFKSANPQKEKYKKFQELEQSFEGDNEMINNSKASWLTSRGNNFGKKGKFDEAVLDFGEAIKLKNDYLPAHFGLAIAYEKKGEHDKAINVINSAPEITKLHGKVIASKKDMMINQINKHS